MDCSVEDRKKLLIIGGTRISLQILKSARELGYAVYVADYNEDSPCKKEADKSFMVSATDTDAIVELIKKEKIDGILMGYADVLLNAYVEICNKAGLPCYANQKAIDITAEKKNFKDYCKKFGIPVVEEYSVEDIRSGYAKFPVIIKPVDNSGARGIFVCHSLDDFERMYAESKKFSKKGEVIIERMMNGKEATIFYYLHDGEIYLLGVGDRWMYQQNEKLLKLPIGYTFPSRHLTDFIRYQDGKIKEMFRSLQMKEGMVFIQTFVEDNTYIVYEMGYRLTGSIEHHLMDKQYGFNHMKAIIKFAVGDDVSADIDKVASLNPHDCCMANVSLLLKEGIIKQIEGLDSLKTIPGVITYHLSHLAGEDINSKMVGTLAQVGLRVLLSAGNQEDLWKRMNAVKETVGVRSTSDEEMIIKDYNYQDICQ